MSNKIYTLKRQVFDVEITRKRKKNNAWLLRAFIVQKRLFNISKLEKVKISVHSHL